MTPWLAGASGTLSQQGTILDAASLLDSGGNTRPVYSLLQYLSTDMPIPGSIYVSESLNPTDQTIKTLVTSFTGDTFFFILSRPSLPDSLNGTLKLIVRNPLYSNAYVAQNILLVPFLNSNMTTTTTTTDSQGNTSSSTVVSPRVDLSKTNISTSFFVGSLVISLTGLPYGGPLLFLSGNVAVSERTPIPPPVSNSGPTPVTLSTIVQLPVNYGFPMLTTYPVGTVYYDSKYSGIYIYVNNAWIPASLLTYV
ncbi:hypothetical protein BDK51DRAFT_37729 [Blyttiomyces helicus]|uniref:Uncharacterized protein n=1 Tax=Blyttiomyces helicus TaxID=388810 RepID=A0A4P9WRI0_9FUNG|nr:hypothetical protein BDK51DRAFT_37729 [Blyttiomyces helicus]|eukprot:RKO93880.1 hypothetical protein BDK51DRAFT_37729 [Blyttiomyces helicus]